MNNFCHLHVHTEYSLLDGYGSPENYAKEAKRLGFKYLACTDHGSIDGLIKFQQASEKYNIKPILGSELYIVPDAKEKDKKQKIRHITILIRDELGFAELCRLLTYANTEGFYKKPRIDYESLLKRDISKLIILTGCLNSFIYLDGAGEFLDELKSRTRVYGEIMPHLLEGQKEHNLKIIKTGLPLVATNDAHYPRREDSEIQEVLLAIQTKAKWEDPNRWKFSIKGLHLRTEEEMRSAFKRLGGIDDSIVDKAIKNSMVIAKRCSNFKIEKSSPELPLSNYRKKSLEDKALVSLSKKALRAKFEGSIPIEYKERCESELELLISKGFARYYLIVKELIDWCKDQKIMVGPGRGSVSGSLVAYLIGITLVDPMKYNLLFSRFISEHRVDLPDIDLDFEDRKRHLVRQHLEEVYGSDNIASISTFLRLKSRGAIREVGRVFSINPLEVDRFTKNISPNQTIQESIEENPSFYNEYSREMDIAVKLDGTIKSCGQHAAALVLSPVSISEYGKGNLSIRAQNKVINWDMEDSEYMGFVKLDVLGLSTLSVLDRCKQLSDGKISFENLPLDDPEIFKQLSKGNTAGVFQFSTLPSTSLAMDMKIDSFADMIACIALVRPGPSSSGMTEEYIKRKREKKWERKHPIYEEITKDTYGVLVYQEQIVKVISQIAGLSESTADEIRKIIAKKKEAKSFSIYKEQFIQGCLDNKAFSKNEAEEFWNGLLGWASYGFSLSHSTAYAMIGYWTAYCKIYYPLEFFCAYLTYGAESGKQDVIDEIIHKKIEIMPPKVGISASSEWVMEKERIYAPFTAIKGIGEKQAITCMRLKENEFSKGQNKGFFTSSVIKKDKSKTRMLLDKIEAFNPNSIPDNINTYLDIEIPMKGLPGLKNIGIADSSQPVRELNTSIKHLLPQGLIKRKRYKNLEIEDCRGCSLRQECDKPVLSSLGKYNIAIIGEAPGKTEDREGVGFVGQAGQILWKELERYNYARTFFHIGNICRCYPSKTKTPTKQHIKACCPYIVDELKNIECRLILALGKTCLTAFEDEKAGIMTWNGKTKWDDNLQAWICWSIHPASILYHSRNREVFDVAIKNFVDKINMVKE